VFVDVYLLLLRQSVLELLDEVFFKVFVPVLLKVSIGAVEAARPLLFVEVNLISLVNKVGRKQKNTQELGELRQKSRMAIRPRHRFNY